MRFEFEFVVFKVLCIIINMSTILPEAVTSVVDQAIQFIYSFEPLVAPSVFLGEYCIYWAWLLQCGLLLIGYE